MFQSANSRVFLLTGKAIMVAYLLPASFNPLTVASSYSHPSAVPLYRALLKFQSANSRVFLLTSQVLGLTENGPWFKSANSRVFLLTDDLTQFLVVVSKVSIR